ncbi:hypothetical protein F6B41_05975 [Microbacterium lushaniae]|nr:hypothetical protein F6B41_32190 [Microbacterium lushaniae]KAA9157412.1 hypothetical protein F6B41_05975 [Microbacterium lushaniae]
MADDPGEPLASAPWIGALISLGSLLRRYLPKLDGRQLVLAISVPRRDYAAALIGAGWMLCSPAPNIQKPIEAFRSADRTKCLRAVTEKIIVTGSFTNLEENRADPRVLTGGKLLPVARYRAVVELDQATPNVVNNVPEPGFLAEFTGAADHWLERLAAPPMDLALVGTAKWLREDLEAIVGNEAAGDSGGARLSNYVLPYGEGAATWSTPIISSARLGEGEKLPESCTAVILDRYGAIKYLNDITVPIVICVIDRSVADESAVETVLEARLSNSRPVSVAADLRWTPPRPIEALGFTVTL